MWKRAYLLNFSHVVFTAEFVKERKSVTYKFLFYIGKKPLIFVKGICPYIPKLICCVIYL
jgi:hypothetical protein